MENSEQKITMGDIPETFTIDFIAVGEKTTLHIPTNRLHDVAQLLREFLVSKGIRCYLTTEIIPEIEK